MSPAQSSGCLLVGVALGKQEAEALVRDCELRVAAIEVVAREASTIAEVLSPVEAATLAARPAEPGYADPCSRLESRARRAPRRRSDGRERAAASAPSARRRRRASRYGKPRRRGPEENLACPRRRRRCSRTRSGSGRLEHHRPHLATALCQRTTSARTVPARSWRATT